jgi:hypothetical protein
MKFPPFSSIPILLRAFRADLGVTADDIRAAAAICGIPVAGGLLRRSIDELPEHFVDEVTRAVAMRKSAERRSRMAQPSP